MCTLGSAVAVFSNRKKSVRREFEKKRSFPVVKQVNHGIVARLLLLETINRGKKGSIVLRLLLVTSGNGSKISSVLLRTVVGSGERLSLHLETAAGCKKGNNLGEFRPEAQSAVWQKSDFTIIILTYIDISRLGHLFLFPITDFMRRPRETERRRDY